MGPSQPPSSPGNWLELSWGCIPPSLPQCPAPCPCPVPPCPCIYSSLFSQPLDVSLHLRVCLQEALIESEESGPPPGYRTLSTTVNWVCVPLRTGQFLSRRFHISLPGMWGDPDVLRSETCSRENASSGKLPAFKNLFLSLDFPL